MAHAQRPAQTLVVGGGIAGLSMALSVALTGRSVHVIEQSSEFKEIGAGIQLAPNALRMLRRLGVRDRVMRDVVRPRQAVLMNAVTGEQITSLDFGELFVETYGEPYVVTHRSDLLAALLEACVKHDLISLENGRTVISARDGPGEGTVLCADGSAYSAPLVIAADGLWSVLRTYVVGDGPPRCHGDVAYRGTVPVSLADPASDMSSVTWWVGPNLHLIQYPVRRGELYNQVGVFTSANFRHGLDPDAYDWGTAEELDRNFAPTDHRVRASAALLGRDRKWMLFDRDPVTSWTRGHFTLTGDAAHPMLQYLAQGACQALEDAVTLGECLTRHDEPAAAVAVYELARVKHTARAQIWARRVGAIVHGDTVVALLRDALLKPLMPTDFRYVDWLYGDHSISSPDSGEFRAAEMVEHAPRFS
jgi:3-hydroxybenzoate 6-monooxygenase